MAGVSNRIMALPALSETSPRTDYPPAGRVTAPYFRNGAWRYMTDSSEVNLVPGASGLFGASGVSVVANGATQSVVARSALSDNRLYEVWASVDGETFIACAKVRTTTDAVNCFVYRDTGVTDFNIEIDFVIGSNTDVLVKNNSGASQSIKYRIQEIDLG